MVFCATLYGWLPNGTFMNIGWRCGKGVINLDKRPLDKYVKHYANIPGDVGVVVFLTYINGTEGDKPALARYVTSFAVDPRETPRRDVVKATIKVKSRGAPQRQDATAKYSLQWPPSQIDEGCIVINGWYMCYYWKLDYIHDADYNTQILLTAVRVLNDYYKFDTLFVRAYLQVSGSNYIYFRCNAAISYNGMSTGYSADIYTITLREQKVYLDLQADLNPSRPVVFAAGFYGDYALARYKEVERSSRCPFGCETGYTADVYLVRPIFQSDGTIQSFVDTDYTPDDANGLSRFFITANRYWSYLTARDDYFLYLDSIDVKNSVNGVDIFSVGIPWPFKIPIPIDVSLTVGVGQVVQTEAFAVALAILHVDYRRTNDVVGRYYTPNAEFRVGDYETRIASLLVDVYTVPQR